MGKSTIDSVLHRIAARFVKKLRLRRFDRRDKIERSKFHPEATFNLRTHQGGFESRAEFRSVALIPPRQLHCPDNVSDQTMIKPARIFLKALS